MITHETYFRVRYGETDRMGYVYYGNYAQYFEVGRVEMLRSLGISYRNLEDEGVLLPVVELTVKYHKPALYDDQLRLVTTLIAMPAVRIEFSYELYSEAGVMLCEAYTKLVFIDRNSNRPRKAPPELLLAIEQSIS